MNEILLPEPPLLFARALAIRIPTPQETPLFLKAANEHFPLSDESRHLKRIRPFKLPISSDDDNTTAVVSSAAEPVLELLLLVVNGTDDHLHQDAANSTAKSSPLIQNGTPLSEDEVEGILARILPPCRSSLRSFSSTIGTGRGRTTARGTSEDGHYTPASPSSTAESKGAELQFHFTTVPCSAPRREPEKWLEANRVWPLTTPKPPPVELPTEAEVKEATRIMREFVLPLCDGLLRIVDGATRVTHVPRKAIQTSLHQGSCAACGDKPTSATQRYPLLDLVAVVVNSSTGMVVSTSEGCTTMRVDNRIATAPYGGAAFSCFSPSLLCSASAESKAVTSSCMVLEHPVMYALKALSQRSFAEHSTAHATRTDSGADTDRDEQPSRQVADFSSPYLANELDLYVTYEPCVMCAMALVHSRIRHVYFLFGNPTHGGVGGRFHVHSIPSLNHHFRGFHCTLAAEEYCSLPTTDAAEVIQNGSSAVGTAHRTKK